MSRPSFPSSRMFSKSRLAVLPIVMPALFLVGCADFPVGEGDAAAQQSQAASGNEGSVERTPVALVQAPAPAQDLAVPETATPVLQAASPTPEPVVRQPAPELSPSRSAALPPQQLARSVEASHLDPNSQIYSERSVFFDFDRSVVKADYLGLVERHGHYLQGSAQVRVRVEGHTDERGSAEYNLALGQRRAQAVVSVLKSYGVAERQIDVVSYGEEKPKVKGHNEAAWAQNRRVDIQYLK